MSISKVLFMITKIQKLSAIHNLGLSPAITETLFMITKIQKLSAIHNESNNSPNNSIVVYDYKDTKIVSNSQPLEYHTRRN